MSGFEAFRADGSLIFSATDSLCRVIGEGWTNGAASGNIVVPQWDGTTRPWFASLNPMSVNFAYSVPGFYVAGNQFLWVTPGGFLIPNIYFLYGVY